MGEGFTVTAHDYPIVVTVYPDLMTSDTLPSYHAQYEALLARGEPFVSLVDMRPCRAMPEADVRKEMVDWGQRVAEERLRLVQGVAFVVTNPLVRAALAVVHWQAPPKQPTGVFADTDLALDSLLAHLDRRGMQAPPTTDLLRRELSTGVVRRSRPIDLEAERLRLALRR